MRRRGFVAWLTGAGLASFFSMGALSRGAFAQGAGAKPPGTPPATPAPGAPPAPPEISDEAKSLHAILKARYGKDLDDTQSQGLLEAIEGGVQSGRALRAKKLANAVEPATVFHATPPADGAGR
jgi:hypothetical protein